MLENRGRELSPNMAVEHTGVEAGTSSTVIQSSRTITKNTYLFF